MPVPMHLGGHRDPCTIDHNRYNWLIEAKTALVLPAGRFAHRLLGRITMIIRMAARILPCIMAICGLTGCVVVIPTIPLNAPGYGHTYQVLDQHDRPLKEGFLILESHYRANDDMFRLYPIKDGRAIVPMTIGTRCSAMYWLYFPLWTVHLENPYGTYVYPVSPGHIYNGGWQVAPWHNPDFMDGLSPPPRILRMREVAADTEREDLEGLAYPAQISRQTKQDQAARDALRQYVNKRLSQLPPSQIVPLDEAIHRGNVQEVRRLLEAGADADFQHLHSLWRPIYWAAMSGNVEIVRLLIDSGARVNVLDAGGSSPLHMASNEEIRKLLLEHGADPTLGQQTTTQPASPTGGS